MIDKSNHVMQAMLLCSAMNSASDAFFYSSEQGKRGYRVE